MKGTYIHKSKQIIGAIVKEATNQGFRVSYCHSIKHGFYKVVVS